MLEAVKNEKENSALGSAIKIGLSEIVDIVKKILEFNRQEQEGQGPKMLTPDQKPGRLPINLAQLKAENNSEKIKNEIRQLLYSLYRSKKLSKTFYNGLINTT